MLGGVLMVLILVIFLPIAMLIGGGVIAAIMSASLNADARARHEGSELVDLNN